LPDFLNTLVSAFAAMEWLEFTGLASGVLCVWLLIRLNVWTFPIGLVYSVASVFVFLQERLYADVLLSGYYVLMNGYGWYYWLYGGTRSEGLEGSEGSKTDELAATRAPANTLLVLAGICLIGVAAMGWFFDTQTDADLPYWDSTTTVLSFVAMWMTARKYIENWPVWLVVNVIATGMYVVKGIELYALLYGIYLVMAVMGWRAWHRTMAPNVEAG
jgi:nicotinamide mononucleotide transporter